MTVYIVIEEHGVEYPAEVNLQLFRTEEAARKYAEEERDHDIDYFELSDSITEEDDNCFKLYDAEDNLVSLYSIVVREL